LLGMDTAVDLVLCWFCKQQFMLTDRGAYGLGRSRRVGLKLVVGKRRWYVLLLLVLLSQG